MNRKRFRNTLFLFVALFLFMFGINSQKTFAAETNQNGVIVETKFDKESYQKGEKVIYSVYMQNTNSEVINIKNINIDVPDGYTLSEESKDQSTKDIQPGDHVLLKYYIDEKKNSGGQDDINNGNTGSTDDKDNIKPGTPAKDDNTKKNPSSIGDKKGSPAKADKKDAKKNSVIEKVKTGDHAKILLWGIIMIIAFSVIIIIAIRSNNKKGLLSLLLIFATLSEIALSPISTKAADNPNQISLSDKFTVNETDKDILIQIQFEKQSNDASEDTTTYTRGKWIQEILTAYGMNDVNLENASETHFTDIETSPYRDAIHIAEIYGIVDQGESFFPEEAVTREFAAVTTVRLLGYQGEGTPTCNDAENISHKSEVFLALKSGAFLLKDGYFNPQNPLNKMDKDQALKHIEYVMKSTEIDSSKNTGFVYKEGVIQLDANTSFKDDGKQLILDKNKKTSDLKSGNIIVIGEDYAYKIDSIQEENNQLIIQYSTPNLEDFLHSMNISGEANKIDWSKGKLADGLKFVENNQPSAQSMLDFDGEFSSELQLPEIELSNGYKLKISFENFSAKYALDVDVDSWRINNAYAILGTDLKATIDVKDYEVENGKDEPLDKAQQFMNDFISDKVPGLDWNQKLKIYEVPLVGPVNLELNLVGGLEGKLSTELTLSLNGGLQIINNAPRRILSINPDFTILGEVEAKWGMDIAIQIKLFNIEPALVSFNLDPLVKASASANIYLTNPLLCMDLKAYLTVEVIAFDECIVGDIFKFSWSYDAFDQDNSPLSLNEHLEIGTNGAKFTDNCSHDPNEYELPVYVYDKSTKQPLEMVEINHGEVVNDYTNKDGLVTIKGNGITVQITAKKEGYIPKTVNINPEDYDGKQLKIALTSIPDGTESYNGHYYKIYSGSMTWYTAKEKCENMGGYLACITSKEEQDFINQLNSSNKRLWIGGIRDNTFKWSWVSGEPWMYENWAPGEPNNSENVISNENCVAIWNSKGQWNDLNNNNTYEQSGYICEWE